MQSRLKLFNFKAHEAKSPPLGVDGDEVGRDGGEEESEREEGGQGVQVVVEAVVTANANAKD